jgi:hypothetical protein
VTVSWPRRRSHCRSGSHAWVAVVLWLMLGVAHGVTAASHDGPDDPAVGSVWAEQDVELYAVVLDRQVLADAMSVYVGSSGLLVPVGELCRLFEIDVSIDGRAGLLKGSLPSGASFAVDPERLVMAVGGTETRIGPGLLTRADGDVFLDVDLLSRLLPIDMTVSANEATITIRARSPLPRQERIAREQRATLLGRGNDRLPVYPTLAVPYRLFAGPFLDQTLQVTQEPGSDGSRSQRRIGYSTHVTGDRLWASFDGYVSGTDRTLWDVRGTLGRKDPTGSLLGPLRATEVGVGDVFNGGAELVMAPASGTGVVVGNLPLTRAALFDRTAMRGSLPDGWAVERQRRHPDVSARAPGRRL